MTVLLAPKVASGQLLLDSAFLRPAKVLNHIPALCTDIEVDEEGNLFLLQTSKHKVHKLFARQDYDSLITVGGKGNGQEGFNFPEKIVCPNRQSLFVLDAQNRRIVMLNTNLKVTRTFEFLSLQADQFEGSEASIWPISFASGPTGELYLLNQEDIKVYKFDTEGAFQLAFGGVDYGNGSLVQPDNLTANSGNFIFVADAENQTVSIFDFYGVFQYQLQLKTSFHWKKMVAYEDHLILFDEHHLYFKNLMTKGEKEVSLGAQGNLVDLAMGPDFFYLLFENEVHLYPTRSR